MIYITVELNKDIYIKIPKVKEGVSPYNLTMTSQAGGQQMVFTDLVDNSDKSSVFRFTLNFTQYTPSGIYNYILEDSTDRQISKGLVQVNMTDSEDYFYQDDEIGYFVEDEVGDMSNYYTKSQIDSMLTQYEKKSDLPDFNNFVTEEELGEYVTSEELKQEVESYINSKDLINSTQLANTLEWYVTLNELQNMGYVTSAELSNAGYVTASELPTVNDSTITIKQGGEVMGTFTLNQSNNAEILLNEGGSGGGISMNDVKQYVDSQGYVMSSSLDSMGYVTSDYLDNAGYVTSTELSNAGYVTTLNLRQNYYNKPETEANFTSYAYIEERISRIPGGGISMDDVKQYVVSQSYVTSSDLTDYATKSYVQGKINDMDLSSYATKSDLNSYVKYSDLNNYGYVTKNELVNQSYLTSSALTDYATKSYVETKIAGIDLSSYITEQELVNQAYITSNDLTDYATKAYVQEKINEIPDPDLSSYVKYTDLNNYGYQTSSQVQNTVNTSISNINTVTLVFTLSDDTTRTIISYVQ